jgi:hypothetical protein
MDNGIDYTYGATVELNIIDIANGFSAPDLTEEMTKKVNDAAFKVFGMSQYMLEEEEEFHLWKYLLGCFLRLASC